MELNYIYTLIKEAALGFGFDAVGFVPAQTDDDGLRSARAKAYVDWCRKGYAGDMQYMVRDQAKRCDLLSVFSWAKTVIVVAVSYYSPLVLRSSCAENGDGNVGRVARYAWGKDYHATMKGRLARFALSLEKMEGKAIKCKTNVDTGPYLERSFAESAGIGFFGKNTNIIIPGVGSYVFIGLLITDLDFNENFTKNSVYPGQSARKRLSCGMCRLCLDACPTGALVSPYTLDARRCISCLTIENKGEIPEDIAPRIGNRVFGCDVCQDVCPHNKRAKKTSWVEFMPDSGTGPELDLDEIADIKTEDEFKTRFTGTPLLRAKLFGLKRNAAVVMKNHESV